jgi:hypothetical protein
LTRRHGIKARNPTEPEGDLIDVWFPGDLILGYYKHDQVNFWNLEVAKFVLENPIAIFQGIREYKKGGFCFVGQPTDWYVAENVMSSFPKNRVFCVYVNPAMCVYEFRAEQADSVQACMPSDSERRFRRKLWPPIS